MDMSKWIDKLKWMEWASWLNVANPFLQKFCPNSLSFESIWLARVDDNNINSNNSAKQSMWLAVQQQMSLCDILVDLKDVPMHEHNERRNVREETKKCVYQIN